MIEPEDIYDLMFEGLPDFAGTWHLYYGSGGGGPRRPGNSNVLLIALAIYAARLAASRNWEGLDQVFRFVEELLKRGSTRTETKVDLTFLEFLGAALNELEIFAAALNEVPVDRAHVEALLGPRTRKLAGLFMGLGLWDTFRLPFGLSARLR